MRERLLRSCEPKKIYLVNSSINDKGICLLTTWDCDSLMAKSQKHGSRMDYDEELLLDLKLYTFNLGLGPQMVVDLWFRIVKD